MNKSIAILGGGFSQLPFIESIQQHGFQTVVFDQNKDCPGSLIADHFFTVSTHKTSAIICILEDFRKSLIACFTYSSFHAAQQSVVDINEYFDLIGLRSKAFKFTSNKNLFRSLMTEVGLLVPRSLRICGSNDYTEFVKDTHAFIVGLQ